MLSKIVAALTVIAVLLSYAMEGHVRTQMGMAELTGEPYFRGPRVGPYVLTGLLLIAVYIAVSKRFGEADRKWAFGCIGLIIGYWLG